MPRNLSQPIRGELYKWESHILQTSLCLHIVWTNRRSCIVPAALSYKTSLDLVEGCCAFTINKLWAFKHSKFSCCEIGAIVHKDQNRWTALRIFDSSNSLASSGSRLNLCVVVRFDNLISYAQKQSVYAVDCASINRIVPDNTPRVSGLQMADLRARYSTPQYTTVQYTLIDNSKIHHNTLHILLSDLN